MNLTNLFCGRHSSKSERAAWTNQSCPRRGRERLNSVVVIGLALGAVVVIHAGAVPRSTRDAMLQPRHAILASGCETCVPSLQSADHETARTALSCLAHGCVWHSVRRLHRI